MLSADSTLLLDESRPVAALLEDEVQDREILFNGPSSFFNVGVHVVKPVLPTLLCSLEKIPLRLVEKVAGDLGPLAV